MMSHHLKYAELPKGAKRMKIIIEVDLPGGNFDRVMFNEEVLARAEKLPWPVVFVSTEEATR